MNKPKWKPLVTIQTYEDRQMNSQILQRRSTIATPEEASERLAPLVNSSGGSPFPPHRSSAPAPNILPPPPPPMPSLDCDTNANPKPSLKPKAPPVPQKTFQQPMPPPCPTPDYDTLSVSSAISTGTLPRQSPPKPPAPPIPPGPRDGVDMESLESFKLNNPGGPKPKPPNTYFNKPKLCGQMSLGSNSSQNSTLKKQRPVSVTIGEYPTGTNKRTPTKFEFLNNMTGDVDQVDSPPNEPITSRFASELAQTLSRSNLKKRTENLENKNGSIKPQTNGTVTISVNNDKQSSPFANGISHKPLTKSQSTDVCTSRNIENLSKGLANRVTIKISELDVNREVPSSILKNGNAQPL